MTSKQKQIIIRLIDLVAVIANEQATKEISGSDWGKRTTWELMEMLKAFKKKNSTPPVESEDSQ